MPKGFFNNHKPLLVRTEDGRNVAPQEHLYYTDSKGRCFRTKTKSDGGSTPFWLWFCLPPFGKKYWYSYILHDGCYRGSIQMFDGKRWRWWYPTEFQSNELLYDALTAQGANELKKALVYMGVEWFGWRSFDKDRKAMCV